MPPWWAGRPPPSSETRSSGDASANRTSCSSTPSTSGIRLSTSDALPRHRSDSDSAAGARDPDSMDDRAVGWRRFLVAVAVAVLAVVVVAPTAAWAEPLPPVTGLTVRQAEAALYGW